MSDLSDKLRIINQIVDWVYFYITQVKGGQFRIGKVKIDMKCKILLIKTFFAFSDLIFNYNVELSPQFDHPKFISQRPGFNGVILNENRIKFRRITFIRRT